MSAFRYPASHHGPVPTLPRLFERLSIGGFDTCWEWHGARSRGYGKIRHNEKDAYVHRVMWELLRGPIPKGLQIDHLCRNRSCANPKHLEVVDVRTNLLRGEGVSAQNARKTHCPQGHEYTPENTFFRASGRRCKTCEHIKDHKRIHRFRRKAA